MICPRCGNEWDATKSPCTRCGLVIRIPSNQPGAPRRGPNPPLATHMQQPGGISMPSASPFTSQPNSGSETFPTRNRPPQSSAPGSGFPSAAQAPNTPRSFFHSSMPETPRSPATPSATPGMENNPAFNRSFSQPPQSRPNFDPAPPRPASSFTRNVPPRPQNLQPPSSRLGASIDTPIQEPPRSPRTPHTSRLVTDPLRNDFPSSSRASGPIPSIKPPLQRSSSAQQGPASFPPDTAQLSPGTLLRGGRYRLREALERQDWLASVSETMWLAQDAQRNASAVMIREVVLPENSSFVIQSTLRTATIALSSVGRHPHIPTLWDAFSDRGRNFFVFEPIEGESLLARMRRTGRVIAEQDIIECCLQMTEILELLAQQSPPLVHGLINPDHIMIGRSGSQFVLVNFSIILAGGATQFISGIERTHLSVYTASEFMRGVIDVRSDLFSLIATAYHAATGSPPVSMNGIIPQAQRLNPNISSQFDAILSKGLRPVASQRYQRPSELRQDLLAMRSVSSTLVSNAPEPPVITQPTNQSQEKLRLEPSPSSSVSASLAQTFQSLVPDEDVEEHQLLLPRPEELPPFQERNDKLEAALWLGGIMLCLLLIVFLSRGFS